LQFKGHNDIIHLNRLNVAGLFACHRRSNMNISVIVYAGSAASGLFGQYVLDTTMRKQSQIT
jgi:hypothetical protein